MSKEVTARAFSSSANLGPGYDILAVAHTAFSDTVRARIVSEGMTRVRVKSEGLPEDPRSNSAGLAVLKMLEELGYKIEVEIEIEKGVPPGLGLGSSGASAAGAAAGMADLLGGLSKDRITYFAALGEEAAAGSPHPDNVAASTVGGFVAVTSISPLHVERIPYSAGWKIFLIVPDLKIEKKTMRARELVPRQIETRLHVETSRNLSGLLLGLSKGDRDLVKKSMRDDIVERARTPMYPYYPVLRVIADGGNAVGVAVSGAGPSVIMLYDQYTNVEYLRENSLKECSKFGFTCTVVFAEVAKGVETWTRK